VQVDYSVEQDEKWKISLMLVIASDA